MTDPYFTAEQRAIIDAMYHHSSAEDFLEGMSNYIRDLEAFASSTPPRPTLADMTEEERDECRWMQCDVQGQGGAWLIVAPFDDDDEDYAHVVGRQGSKSWGFPAERITPRPDLPRLEWPGNKKPAPALPDGWRLADHKGYGRVIVTTQTPDRDGYVYVVIPDAGNFRGYDWHFCDPDELTYLDQEGDQ